MLSLHEAARKGLLNEVKDLVEKQGVDVNAEDKYGYTILHVAIYKGFTEIVKFLIENGADVNAKDKYGATPLHYAAQCGYKGIVKLLVDKDADIDAKNRRGYTPLNCAAFRGDVDIVRYLIKNGANVKGKSGVTPLHLATGHIEVARYLLKKGADVNAQDYEGKTALHWAAENGHKDVILLLLIAGADTSLMDSDNMTPISLAENGRITQIFEGASELQEMKSKIIGKSGVSFLDFLTADEASLTRYAHNSELLAALQKNKEQYKNDCPTLAKMIDDQCKAIDVICKAIEERRRLKNEALEPLGSLCADVLKREVVDEDLCRSIATYLTNASLTTLITAGKGCK